MSGTASNHLLRTSLAAFPVLVYAHSAFFGFHKVKGASMEPAIRDGDVVLVRKFEPLFISMATDGDDQEQERARLRRYDQLQGSSLDPSFSPRHGLLNLYCCPPTIISGHVIVFKHPSHFPGSCDLKRVVGVGGQWVRLKDPLHSRLKSLAPYSLFVEGDNDSKDRTDSNDYGPVSHNLLVGIAEYVVWPPLHWKKIERKVVNDGAGKVRAFWP